MFNRREIFYLIITILVTTLAFAFNDGKDTLVFGFWIQNFIAILAIVTFSFLIHQFAHKIVARSNGFDTEFKWWGVQHFGGPKATVRRNERAFPRKIRIFGKDYKIESFPVGIVISLFVTIITAGMFWFVAVGQYALLLRRSSRFGKAFVEILDYEEAKIALAGPMSHIIIMTVFSFFNGLGTFDQVIFINAVMAVTYMLPIHRLDGTKIYFGSRILYISSLIFIVSMIVLVYTISTIPMIIISAIATILAAILYYYFHYYR